MKHEELIISNIILQSYPHIAQPKKDVLAVILQCLLNVHELIQLVKSLKYTVRDLDVNFTSLYILLNFFKKKEKKPFKIVHVG